VVVTGCGQEKKTEIFNSYTKTVGALAGELKEKYGLPAVRLYRQEKEDEALADKRDAWDRWNPETVTPYWNIHSHRGYPPPCLDRRDVSAHVKFNRELGSSLCSRADPPPHTHGDIHSHPLYSLPGIIESDVPDNEQESRGKRERRLELQCDTEKPEDKTEMQKPNPQEMSAWFVSVYDNYDNKDKPSIPNISPKYHKWVRLTPDKRKEELYKEENDEKFKMWKPFLEEEANHFPNRPTDFVRKSLPMRERHLFRGLQDPTVEELRNFYFFEAVTQYFQAVDTSGRISGVHNLRDNINDERLWGWPDRGRFRKDVHSDEQVPENCHGTRSDSGCYNFPEMCPPFQDCHGELAGGWVPLTGGWNDYYSKYGPPQPKK